LLSEEGTIGLAEANPDAYREISRFEVPKGSLPTWSPLVISDARLYFRDQDNLIVFDIKDEVAYGFLRTANSDWPKGDGTIASTRDMMGTT
jgi:hypothetical protein